MITTEFNPPVYLKFEDHIWHMAVWSQVVVHASTDFFIFEYLGDNPKIIREK